MRRDEQPDQAHGHPVKAAEAWLERSMHDVPDLVSHIQQAKLIMQSLLDEAKERPLYAIVPEEQEELPGALRKLAELIEHDQVTLVAVGYQERNSYVPVIMTGVVRPRFEKSAIQGSRNAAHQILTLLKQHFAEYFEAL